LSALVNKKIKVKDIADTRTEFFQAQKVAYQFLARRSHSCLEMKEKLQTRGFSPEVVSSVLEELESKNYLNDRVFAMDWAKKAIEHKHLGPHALRMRLHLKGIDREIIEEILQKIYSETDEEQVAQRAIKKRLEDMRQGHQSSTLGRKLAGYLARKGFTPEVIEKVLKNEIQ